jgi:hypothetical protein
VEDDVRFLRLDDRPQPVRWAVWLILCNQLSSVLIVTGRVLLGSERWTVLIPTAFGFVVFVGLALATANGRRWAFVLYGLAFLGGLASFALGLGAETELGLPVFTWHLLALVLDAAGIVLLLMPRSREWFAAAKAARRAGAAAS